MPTHKKKSRSAFTPEHQRQMAKWRIAGLLANAQQVKEKFGLHLHEQERIVLLRSIFSLQKLLRNWGKE